MTKSKNTRVSLSFLSARWNTTLTTAQREAWNLYAANTVVRDKRGKAFRVSGFNHYVRSNGKIVGPAF